MVEAAVGVDIGGWSVSSNTTSNTNTNTNICQEIIGRGRPLGQIWVGGSVASRNKKRQTILYMNLREIVWICGSVEQ